MISLSYDVNDHVYFKVKIHLTSHGFIEYQSYSNFEINLDGFIDVGLDFLLTTKLNNFDFEQTCE